MKHAEAFLKGYDDLRVARASLKRWVARCDGARPQQSLGCRTPDEGYFGAMSQKLLKLD